MTQYRIVCTKQEPVDKPHEVAHIVSVGIGSDPDKAERGMTLADVLRAMKTNDTFYTRSPSTGRIATVNEYQCKTCWRSTIRSSPNALRDNNLDNLRECGGFS
ncbi:MAG: hypothetical protein M3530_11445 [Thermoproteota archaeon]|jgi:hypothetical protein|nr:hypothetical protein [Thermoproteota archaeon]